MIEILLKNKEIIKVNSTDEISAEEMDFYAIQFVDYTEQQIKWVQDNYGITCSLMERHEDIEISSHFLVKNDQTAFHISIPYYCSKERGKLIESPIFFVMSTRGLFFFSNSSVDKFFNRKYTYRFSDWEGEVGVKDILMFQLEVISDYYADITEYEAKEIKKLASAVLLDHKSSKGISQLITVHNFNNLLLKESLIETIRVFNLYKKSVLKDETIFKDSIDAELYDLSVVSDYIQFNFERLENLRENVKNNIDLEQNYIFKVLTVITLCVSLPAVITGVYGMNFANMPELHLSYAYPVIIVLLILSAVLPYVYFKRKRWL